KDHHGLRMIGQDVAKRRKQRAFFVLDRAATHQNRAGSRADEALAKASNDPRRRRRSHIEFQVAGDPNFRFRRANFYETLPVFLGLSQKTINVRERLLQQFRQPEPEPLVAGKRAVRNAAVDNSDASPAALGKPEKIWPEFCLGDDHEVGPEGESEVQGEIENVLRAESLGSEFLPGAGGR